MSSNSDHELDPQSREDEIVLFECDECSKTFVKRSSLVQHRRRIHVQKNRYQCAHCDYAVQQKYDLIKHLQRLHLKPTSSPTVIKQYSCLLCDHLVSKNRKGVIEHYIEGHGVQLQEHILSFSNMTEFEVWKSNVERTDVCHFVHSQGPKNRNGFRVLYLRCFRSGDFRSEGKGLRRPKLKGSNKINGVCPASIKAVEDKATGFVEVTFMPDHIGHSKEIDRLKLTREERSGIATMLADQHLELDQLPYETDRLHSGKSEPVRRIHLVSKKDLWNIRRSFKLNKSNGEPPQDLDTVEMTIVEPVKQDSELVRYYNAQNSLLNASDVDVIAYDDIDEKKQKIRNRVEEILEKVASHEDLERVLNALSPIAPASSSRATSESKVREVRNGVIILKPTSKK
ncbi:Zinc finger protein [Nesidiocoris tenuis]|uniref:Zinc finger protein n=1 Tax=Nesidiocoris tenuis TaxID=355587 RepID=A0ABN7AS00_9HEMI|nr:Zinc finger protein [Nesidiocoris tenuis]